MLESAACDPQRTIEPPATSRRFAKPLNRWSVDLAELALALPRKERIQVLRLIQPKRAAETFAYLDLDTQQGVLSTFSEDESKFVLNEMAPDDRSPCWRSAAGRRLEPLHQPSRSRTAPHCRPRSSRIPRRQRRPAHDSRLSGRPPRVDHASRPRPYPRPRTRPRDAECHLHHRREQQAGRRPADPRDPAGPSSCPRRRLDGP